MSMNLLDTPAPRVCGDCALCCKLPEIPVLSKKAGEWCRNCSTHKTCDAYEVRPEPCREFNCQYITNPNLSEDWRPTTARFVLALKQAAGKVQVVAMVDPATPHAWRQEPYFSAFKQWANDHYVMITHGDHKLAFFPDHEVDFGKTEAGDVIEYIGIPLPNGDMRVSAQLRKSTGDVIQ